MAGIERSGPGAGRPTTAAGTLLLAGEWTAAAAFVVAVYEVVVGIVVRVWPDLPDDRVLLFWIAAAAICGAGTGPVRAGVRGAAARRWPGVGVEAYATLAAVVAEAAEQIAGPVEGTDLPPGAEALARLAEIARVGTRAARVRVWVAESGGHVGHGGLRCAASQPMVAAEAHAVIGRMAGFDELTGASVTDQVFAVTESGALLGAMTFTPPSSTAFTARDLRLAADLANAAGPLLRALDLDEQLRERIRLEADQVAAMDRSRRRLIAARDEAREQLGREIQAEVCVALEHCAETLAALADAPPTDAAASTTALITAVSALSQETDQAIARFRRLVRGVYPAALTDHGLGPALENLAADLPRPATVADPVAAGSALPRFPAPVEACAYFCLSALLRSWPGAPDGDRILIVPRVVGGDLVVSVSASGSDTPHLDARVLESIRDRAAALDGDVVVDIIPGRPTVVVRIPIPIPVDTDGAS